MAASVLRQEPGKARPAGFLSYEPPFWLVAVLLILAGAGMFLTAPVGDDFFWSDAPRHALNGAFIADLVHDMPWKDPVSWAMQYYIRYPALTILFYPPFFYVVEAAIYGLCGVSHMAAQLAVSLFVILLGFVTYGLGRFALGRTAALGMALMLMGAPEVAFWSRQVMLDIPAYGLGVGGMLCLCLWLRHGAPRYLYFAGAAFLAAIYTKYNIAFLILPAALAALAAQGWRLLRDRNVLAVLAIGAVLALPAAFLMIHFGDANFGSVSGRPGDLARFSLKAWLFYLEQMPKQLSYPVLAAALGGTILALAGRVRPAMPAWFALMLTVWFVSGYVTFSLIEVREPRHDMVVLFPVVLMAAIGLESAGKRLRCGGLPALLMGCALYGYSLAMAAPPVVTGFRQVAAYVAADTPRNGVVLFAGYRDGNFVFAIREHSERRDLTVLRADKLLLRIAVERIRGVEEAHLDEAAILSLLKSAGVSVVVAQPDFWQDIPQMARLYRVLNGPAFRLDRSFPISGAIGSSDSRDAEGGARLNVFKATYPVQTEHRPLSYELPIIGHTVTGRVGGP